MVTRLASGGSVVRKVMPVVRKQRELGLRGISRTVPPASGLPLLLFAEGEVRSLSRV